MPRVVATVLLGAWSLACNVTCVSFSEGERAGDDYYRRLQSGNTAEVMRLYSSEFANQEFRERWATFLDERTKLWGPYQTHSLVGKQFLPRVKDDPSIPADQCFVMRYAVVYASVKDQETLIFCPDPTDQVLRIAGHTLEREGARPVRAGMSLKETGIRVGE